MYFDCVTVHHGVFVGEVRAYEGFSGLGRVHGLVDRVLRDRRRVGPGLRPHLQITRLSQGGTPRSHTTTDFTFLTVCCCCCCCCSYL